MRKPLTAELIWHLVLSTICWWLVLHWYKAQAFKGPNRGYKPKKKKVNYNNHVNERGKATQSHTKCPTTCPKQLAHELTFAWGGVVGRGGRGVQPACRSCLRSLGSCAGCVKIGLLLRLGYILLVTNALVTKPVGHLPEGSTKGQAKHTLEQNRVFYSSLLST